MTDKGMHKRLIAILLSAQLSQVSECFAAPCANPDAIGPSSRFEISARDYPRVGKAQKFPQLPLESGDIVLTFDDGPVANTTPEILSILASECVTATFFEVGAKAKKWPEITRQVILAGNTVGTHSFSHADLTKLPTEGAIAEITGGIEAVDAALSDIPRPESATRLFRFPNNAATPELLDYAYSHGLAVISIDMQIGDWVPTSQDELLRRLDVDLARNDRGILLLHDSMPTTVAALPAILAELKRRHMRIVQLIPK